MYSPSVIDAHAAINEPRQSALGCMGFTLDSSKSYALALHRRIVQKEKAEGFMLRLSLGKLR